MDLLANLDSGETIFFRRELEQVRSKSYEVKYKNLKFRELCPVDNSGGPGVDTVVTQVYDQLGSAKIIAAYSADLPRSDISAREFISPVRTIGSSFGYSKEEIAKAQRLNKGLEQRKANACRRTIEEKLNNIFFGSDPEATKAGLIGLLNNPNIPVGNVVNPGAGTEWVNKSPAEILFDTNEIFSSIHETTLMVEQASRLLLPVAQWNFITASPRSINSDTTILQYLVMNSPFLTSVNDVIPVNELKGAGSGGEDIMLAYDPDPDKLVMDIPHELEFLDIQIKNLEFITPAWARAGGVTIFYPLSIAIREGI